MVRKKQGTMLCLQIMCLCCFSAFAVGFKKGGNSILARKQQKLMDTEVDGLLQRLYKLSFDKLENQGEYGSEDKKQISNLRDSVGRSPDQKYTQIFVTNGGNQGEWGTTEYCAEGSYAVGYELKIQPKQADGIDDTALNGIRLLCEYPDGRNGGSPTSTIGDWGKWTESSTCGSNHVLSAFQLQVAPRLGFWGDDTAATFVQFKCRDLVGSASEHVISVPPGNGTGDYGTWSDSCPPGEAICGLKTRVKEACGTSCDDTALNDAILYCCSW